MVEVGYPLPDVNCPHSPPRVQVGSVCAPVSRRHVWAASLACGSAAILAIAVRLPQLDRLGVWIDESFSLKMAEFGFVEIWERTAQDTHPPLYYWLLKLWTSVCGDSVLSARILSVLIGVGTVLCVYLLTLEICRRDTSGQSSRDSRQHFAPWLAALLTALSPLQISWSMQIRMYELTALLVAAMSWQLLKAIRARPPATMRWAGVTLLAVALLYTHNYGVFAVGAAYLFALMDAVRPGRQKSPDVCQSGVWTRCGPGLASGFIVYLLWSPWLLSLLEQQSRVATGFWTAPLSWRWVGEQFSEQFLVRAHPDVPPLIVENALAPVVGFVVLQATLLVLIGLALGRQRSDWYIIVAVALPIAASIVISVTLRNIVYARYFLSCNMLLLVAVARLIARVPLAIPRVMFAGIAIAGMAVLCYAYHQRRSEMAANPGMRAVMADFDQRRQAAEPLVVGTPVLYFDARVYSADPHAVRLYGAPEQHPFYLGTAAITSAECLDSSDLQSLKGDWIWTLARGGFWEDSSRVRLGPEWKLIGERRLREFHGEIVLRLHQRTPSS